MNMFRRRKNEQQNETNYDQRGASQGKHPRNRRRHNSGNADSAGLQGGNDFGSSYGTVGPIEPNADEAKTTQSEGTQVQAGTDAQRSHGRGPVAGNVTTTQAHLESAIYTLTAKLQSCFVRLDAIDQRMDELSESIMHAPSHSDVLEVRMHSAKLAAELARTTIELRGEIGLAGEETRRALRASAVHDTAAQDELPTEQTSSFAPFANEGLVDVKHLTSHGQDVNVNADTHTESDAESANSRTHLQNKRPGWSASA